MIKKFGMMAIALGAVLAGALTVYAPSPSKAMMASNDGKFVCFIQEDGVQCRPATSGEYGASTSGYVNLMVYSYMNYYDTRWEITVTNYRWDSVTNTAVEDSRISWSQDYEPSPHYDPASPEAAMSDNGLCCYPEPSYSDYFKNKLQP